MATERRISPLKGKLPDMLSNPSWSSLKTWPYEQHKVDSSDDTYRCRCVCVRARMCVINGLHRETESEGKW